MGPALFESRLARARVSSVRQVGESLAEPGEVESPRNLLVVASAAESAEQAFAAADLDGAYRACEIFRAGEERQARARRRLASDMRILNDETEQLCEMNHGVTPGHPPEAPMLFFRRIRLRRGRFPAKAGPCMKPKNARFVKGTQQKRP